jgi:hypothetical protein
MNEQIESRCTELRAVLNTLVTSQALSFDSSLWSRLPERQGIYRIYLLDAPMRTLRAGRTKQAAGGLRQRVYRNHYMGDQPGNIRQQLVDSGSAQDLKGAKVFLQQRCRIQVHVIDDEAERRWAEYFMLSILRPDHCD